MALLGKGDPKPMDLDIRNTNNSQCAICQIKALNEFDSDMFLRRLQFTEFTQKAVMMDVHLTEIEFRNHVFKHLYVHQDIPQSDTIKQPSELLVERLNAVTSQLAEKEKQGCVDNQDYTKKIDLFLSLLELYGKFTGAYTNKVELTNDFKTMMIQKIKNIPLDGEDAVEMTTAIGSSIEGVKEKEKKKKDEPGPIVDVDTMKGGVDNG